MFFKNYFITLVYFVCVWGHITWSMYEGQKTVLFIGDHAMAHMWKWRTLGGNSPSTMWVLVFDLKSCELAALPALTEPPRQLCHMV